MKVAFFMIPPLTTGAGAEKYFIELANELSTRCDEVTVVSLDKKFLTIFRKLLRIFYRLDFFSSGEGLGNNESVETVTKNLGKAKWIRVTLGDLTKTLKEFDVIYSKNELVELGLLKLLGIKKLPPVIVGVHTPLYYAVVKTFHEKLHNFLYTGFIYKWLLKGVTLVHLSNKFTKELVDKKFKVSSKLIYYPFSVQDISKKSEQYSFEESFDADKVNIVFAARMTEQKGVGSLVNIVDYISKNNDISNKVVVNVFGNGALENLVVELANRHNFVRYYGFVKNKFIPNILSRQDMFITTAKWETLPFNVLEAQAIGLPVLAFDIPGPNDIIENAKTGYIVKTEEEFADKIIQFVLNKKKFERDVIQDHIRGKFGYKKIHNDLFEMFTNVANAKDGN